MNWALSIGILLVSMVTLHAQGQQPDAAKLKADAIDTALAACAAAVLDTDHGVVASETLPMVRGHAESLIPLTAP
jgi:hypothetical protein